MGSTWMTDADTLSWALVYTEQMDAESLGRKLLLTPLATPRKHPKSKLWLLWPHLTKCSPCKHFRALSMWHCKERWPGPRRGFWVISSSLSPKRPRPFTHSLALAEGPSKGRSGQCMLHVRTVLIGIEVVHPEDTKHTKMLRRSQSRCQLLCDDPLGP